MAAKKNKYAFMEAANRELVRRYGHSFRNPAAALERHLARAPGKEAEIRRAVRLSTISEAAYRREQHSPPGAAPGPRAHTLNLAGESKRHRALSEAIAELVGVVQDLMRLSDSSLSRVLHTLASKQRSTRFALAVMGRLVPLTPAGVYSVLGGIVSKYAGVQLETRNTHDFWHGVSTHAKHVVDGILADREVDVRPLARAVIDALEPAYAVQLARGVLKSVLDTYIETAYVSKGGPRTVCLLCAEVASCRAGSAPGHGGGHHKDISHQLGALLGRALHAVNALLSIAERPTTVTEVARRALDTYVGARTMTAASWTGPAWTLALQKLRAAVYPRVNALMHRVGLAISPQEFERVLTQDLAKIRAVVARTPGASIEPVLVHLVVAAQPGDLVRGAVAVGSHRVPGRAFCTMCSTMCPGG